MLSTIPSLMLAALVSTLMEPQGQLVARCLKSNDERHYGDSLYIDIQCLPTWWSKSNDF